VFAPLPFALHATTGCPPHAELALSIAWTFEEVDAAALDAELDAHTLPPPLTWRCAHETAGLVLDELERRWLARGCLDHALQAAELRMCLPFDENGVRAAERRLATVKARLN
jgi:hypothetical protein